MTRVSERLWQRLCAMGLADRCGVGLRPLRPSLASRRAGAWSWAAIDTDGIPLGLGSSTRMAELLAAKRLVAILERVDVVVDVVHDHAPIDAPAGEWTWTSMGQILLEGREPE